MIIKDIELTHFGKFHNHKIEFNSGFNLISGNNEAGKSTIHSFIQGMFFGIEKTRGRASKRDVYSQYEPWENRGGYGGVMRIEVDGIVYRIERSFLKTNKSLKLIDETNGKELKPAQEKLDELLGGMTESAYVNTISIAQLRSATDEGLVQELKNCITNLNGAKSIEVDLSSAEKFLVEERKKVEADIEKKTDVELVKYNDQLKDVNRQIENEVMEEKKLIADLDELVTRRDNNKLENATHKDALLDEIIDLQTRKQSYAQQLEQSKAYNEKLKSKPKEKSKLELKFRDSIKEQKRGIIVLAIIAAILLLCIGYAYYTHNWLVAAVCVGLIAVVLTKIVQTKEEEPKVEKESFIDTSALENQIKELDSAIAVRLKEKYELDEKMNMGPEIQSLKEKIDRSQWNQEKLQEQYQIVARKIDFLEHQSMQNSALKQQILAINLAKDRLSQIYSSIHGTFGKEMNQLSSKYLSQITNGKYTDLIVNEDLTIFLNTKEKLIPIEQVSKGTIDQIYLCIRLAATKMLWNIKNMPLILDDVFAFYDGTRLQTSIDLLRSQDCQVILLTCHDREKELLVGDAS